MHRDDHVYLRVDLPLIQELGVGEAVLYAFLRFACKYQKKDKDGYCPISSKFICDQLKLARRTMYDRRDRLVTGGLIELRQGVNQNEKCLYRIMDKR